MERHEIINILSAGRYSQYLEIGVDWGTTFNSVDIGHKVGVDPFFKVPQSELDGETFDLLSDDYFASYRGRKFDCVFVDGLHTYEQSKRDFLNGWADLSPDGIVIIDDCYPADELSSLASLEECRAGRVALGTPDDHTWMGDVYKTAIWINDCTDYCFSYVRESLGVVVVWQERVKGRKKWFSSEEEIANCSFSAFKQLPIPSASVHDLARRIAPKQGLASKIAKWMAGS